MALAPHLWMVVWPHKFQPHLSEKYDGMVNPVKFLKIYSTSILVTGGERNTIPCISNTSVLVTFHQGERDEKMLEKRATHDIQDVVELFSLADKYAKAAEGRA
jgi:hypothetical protein